MIDAIIGGAYAASMLQQKKTLSGLGSGCGLPGFKGTQQQNPISAYGQQESLIRSMWGPDIEPTILDQMQREVNEYLKDWDK